MRKLALVSLAALAAAALPAAAAAQPRSGHSWGQPGQRVIVRHGGPQSGPHMGPGMHRDFRHIRRFNRGHIVPSFWWGPQFQVQHWQMYGFPEPMPGHRWVRYYDDAYMIDGRGRVHEGRYGLDWDRYGDRWGRDDRGIPVYVGDGDWRPEGRDYEWAEEIGEERGGWDYSEYGGERGPGHGCEPRRGHPCGGPSYPAPGPAPAYGHGGGYGAAYGYGGGYGGGYGYMCCATVTITETIVETGGSSESYEVVEEEVVRQRARRVHRRPPARRPIRGERG
jgi:Ni/Co efflux regulator RcnB